MLGRLGLLAMIYSVVQISSEFFTAIAKRLWTPAVGLSKKTLALLAFQRCLQEGGRPTPSTVYSTFYTL